MSTSSSAAVSIPSAITSAPVSLPKVTSALARARRTGSRSMLPVISNRLTDSAPGTYSIGVQVIVKEGKTTVMVSKTLILQIS